MSAGRIIFATALLASLAGCGVKPLKAPCARDEGPRIVPMAYSSLGGAKVSDEHECGPMKFVNPQGGKGRVVPSPGRAAP